MVVAELAAAVAVCAVAVWAAWHRRLVIMVVAAAVVAVAAFFAHPNWLEQVMFAGVFVVVAVDGYRRFGRSPDNEKDQPA